MSQDVFNLNEYSETIFNWLIVVEFEESQEQYKTL